MLFLISRQDNISSVIEKECSVGGFSIKKKNLWLGLGCYTAFEQLLEKWKKRGWIVNNDAGGPGLVCVESWELSRSICMLPCTWLSPRVSCMFMCLWFNWIWYLNHNYKNIFLFLEIKRQKKNKWVGQKNMVILRGHDYLPILVPVRILLICSSHMPRCSFTSDLACRPGTTGCGTSLACSRPWCSCPWCSP